MEISDKNFIEHARNPDNWLFAAKRNYAVAKLLFDNLYNNKQKNASLHETSGLFYAGFFHAGVAIENALKAVFISQEPDLINSSKISGKRILGTNSGHELLVPALKLLPELNEKEQRFLRKLEVFTWAGRYFVPTNKTELENEDIIQNARMSTFDEQDTFDKLFDKIIKLIKNE